MVFVIGNNMYFSNEYSQNMVKAKKRSPVTDVIGLFRLLTNRSTACFLTEIKSLKWYNISIQRRF